jgi:hypothetical protein
MNGPRVTRRQTLVLALGLGLVGASVAVARRTPSGIAVEARPALRGALESVLSDADATRRFGGSYLQTQPSEASVDLLLRRLPMPGRTADAAEAAAIADPSAVLARIGTAVTDDFARGDTVVIDGWVVGRSEARFAALLALLGS